MSDSDSTSPSSSDSEDLNTTGLIATRAKRSTAGNLYASLRANLDDEELQKELLAEDAEDVGEYVGSDKEGDDDEDALESASDDDDQGPPKEGDEEDLEGEKQLQKQERAEARKKRSLKDARLKVPGGGWGRPRKRVRLVEDVTGGDGGGEGESDGEGGEVATARKPKKKSERSNWLPTAEDGPVRQSGRSLAVANREIIHANLKQSAARSEKQRRVMKDAAEREQKKRLKHAELTQEERILKCERVERETAKELGRFEREEAERQRLRDEALAKRRRRGVEGPVFRTWSGSCVWEGDRVKVKRVEHGSLGVQELGEVGKSKDVELEADIESGAQDKKTNEEMADSVPVPQELPTGVPTPTPAPDQAPSSETPVAWLQGIEQYAAQSAPASNPTVPANATMSAPVKGFTPSAPATSTPPAMGPAVQPSQHPQIHHSWSSSSQAFNQPHEAPPLPQAPAPVPAPSLIREQAQRTLLILEDFPELAADSSTTKSSKRKSLASTTTSFSSSRLDAPSIDALTPNAIQNLLLPSAYPVFTPLQQSYLLTKPRKSSKLQETLLPPAPPKAKCAMTQWEGKFRDPKSGVVYADLHAYKALQRVLAGGVVWSGVFGAWVGTTMGAGLLAGRAARGVPEGFAGPVKSVKVERGGG